MAKGKYLWFIDFDDYIETNSIDKIINILLEKKNIGMLLFGYKEIRDKKVSSEFIPEVLFSNKDIYIQPTLFNSPWNKIYNREIIVCNNLKFIESSHMGEDMNFNFKYLYFLNEREIKIVREAYYNYNYNYNNGVTNNINKRFDIFNSFDDIVKFYKEKDNFEEMREILCSYYKNHAIRYVYDAIAREKLRSKNFLYKKEIKKLCFNIKKRKEYFRSNFLILQSLCIIKVILYSSYKKYRNYKGN